MRSCSPSKYSISTVSSVRQTIAWAETLNPFPTSSTLRPSPTHQVFDISSKCFRNALNYGDRWVALSSPSKQLRKAPSQGLTKHANPLTLPLFLKYLERESIR
jgi:hypothetical protein